MRKYLAMALAAGVIGGAVTTHAQSFGSSGFGTGSSSSFGGSSSGSFGSRMDNPRVGSQSDVPLPGAGPSSNTLGVGNTTGLSTPPVPSGPPTASRCPPGQSFSLTLNSCDSVADPNAGRTLPGDMAR